jgi:hypothetical protein
MIDYTSMAAAFFAALIFIAVILLLFQRRTNNYPYFAREYLLTFAEQKFYRTLKTIAQDRYGIAFKVRLADIINCTDANWRKGFGPKISSKHIDFVLFDLKSTKIILCIELDDRSHRMPGRIARDAFVDRALNAAGVPLCRIAAARGYDMAMLEKEIAVHIGKTTV